MIFTIAIIGFLGFSIAASAADSTIPEWIKNNAKWWTDGTIDDDAFIQGIEFLVKEGIIQV